VTGVKEPKPLTVRVAMTVTLNNPGDWTTTFGVEGRAAIRQDVKEYVLYAMQNYWLFTNGEVDARISPA
jgi:hypothetical protein